MAGPTHPRRSRLYTAGLITQSLLYVAGGVNHFLSTSTYAAVMPPHYAHPAGLVQISGAAEILGGIGLVIPATRRFSAFGLIAMLLVYCDVHLFMAEHPERFANIPAWALYARLPLQLVLIAWAAAYARRSPKPRSLMAG